MYTRETLNVKSRIDYACGFSYIIVMKRQIVFHVKIIFTISIVFTLFFREEFDKYKEIGMKFSSGIT